MQRTRFESSGPATGKALRNTLKQEEMAQAEDLGEYYRVPADVRDLNYSTFFSAGKTGVSKPSTTIRTMQNC